MVLDFLQNRFLHRLQLLAIHQEPHGLHEAFEFIGPQVGGHDDDRITEIDFSATAIRQETLIKNLQEEIEHIGVRLLDLIQENHGVGIIAHLVSQNSPALGAHDSPGHADEFVHGNGGVPVLGHVQAHHLLFIPEKKFGQGFGQFCLAHARRAKEKEYAVGPFEIFLQRPFIQAEVAGQSRDRLPLPHHPAAQDLFHVSEPLGRVPENHFAGNARLLGDHLNDIFPQHGPAGISDFYPHRSRVQPVNSLVGKPQVMLVARGHSQGRLDGFFADLNRIIFFQARADAPEDFASLMDVGLLDGDDAKTPGQGFVFRDVNFIFTGGGGSDHLDFPPGQGGFKDGGRVRGYAQGCACSDQGMRFIHEDDQVLLPFDLLDHILDAILEHPPEHGSRHQGIHLQVDNLIIPQPSRHLFWEHFQLGGQPLYDGGLAHSWLAQNHHRIGAVAMAQNLHDLPDLRVSPDNGR